MSSPTSPPPAAAPAPGPAPASALDGPAGPAQAAPLDGSTKPSVLDAAKTIRPLEDLQRLPNMPCARYSLLFGIVAGVSVGCLRFVFSRTARRGTLMGGGGGAGRWAEVGAAANWAVGAWGVGSLGAWCVLVLLSFHSSFLNLLPDDADPAASTLLPPSHPPLASRFALRHSPFRRPSRLLRHLSAPRLGLLTSTSTSTSHSRPFPPPSPRPTTTGRPAAPARRPRPRA